MTKTFAQMQDEVSKMEIVQGNLADRVDDILDRARINADDTCFVEKGAPVTEYDNIALATVSEILSYSTDKEACDWFSTRGLTW